LDNKTLKTGTTTVGIVCKDSVILAADMRATVGNLIADTGIDKVLSINEDIAVAISGNVSSIQMLVKYMQSELKLLTIKTGRKPTAKEAANLLRNWVYGLIRRPSMMSEVAHFIFAGKDKHGTHLYEIFPDGTLLQEKDYKAGGSGMMYALGVLETRFKPGLSTQEGIELAEKCISAAIQRDSASGNGVNIFVIDKDGARKVLTKTVNTHFQ
jgi:proteasome beta subunit